LAAKKKAKCTTTPSNGVRTGPTDARGSFQPNDDSPRGKKGAHARFVCTRFPRSPPVANMERGTLIRLICLLACSSAFAQSIGTFSSLASIKSSSADCVTSDGKTPNKRCVFPFTARGVTYESCTYDIAWVTHEHFVKTRTERKQSSNSLFALKSLTSLITATKIQPWCSTKVDANGKHINGNWGTCEDASCPKPPRRIMPFVLHLANNPHVLRLRRAQEHTGPQKHGRHDRPSALDGVPRTLRGIVLDSRVRRQSHHQQARLDGRSLLHRHRHHQVQDAIGQRRLLAEFSLPN